MVKKDRTGNRKTREQRKQFKVSELGYYLLLRIQRLQSVVSSQDFIRNCRKM